MTEKEPIVMDSEKTTIRPTGGCLVAKIPRRWERRGDAQAFFNGDVDVRLVRKEGQLYIEVVPVGRKEK